jgi:hypothetical protein
VPAAGARGRPARRAQFAKTSPSAARGRRSCCMLQRIGPKKFTEPVALLSTSPGNLRLPPTAPASCFDLLALRARCKSKPNRPAGVEARAATAKSAHFAHSELSTFPRFLPRPGDNPVDSPPAPGQGRPVRNLPKPRRASTSETDTQGSDAGRCATAAQTAPLCDRRCATRPPGPAAVRTGARAPGV